MFETKLASILEASFNGPFLKLPPERLNQTELSEEMQPNFP